MVQRSLPYMTTGKTIALTIWTFVGKVMYLLFNILSRFVITFLPMWVLIAQSYLTLCNPKDCSPPGSPVHGILQARILEWVAFPFSISSKEQESFNFMAAVTVCSDFGAQENKVCHCFHCFPIYLPWSDGTGCHDLRYVYYTPVKAFCGYKVTSSFQSQLHYCHSQCNTATTILRTKKTLCAIFPPEKFQLEGTLGKVNQFQGVPEDQRKTNTRAGLLDSSERAWRNQGREQSLSSELPSRLAFQDQRSLFPGSEANRGFWGQVYHGECVLR